MVYMYCLLNLKNQLTAQQVLFEQNNLSIHSIDTKQQDRSCD